MTQCWESVNHKEIRVPLSGTAEHLIFQSRIAAGRVNASFSPKAFNSRFAIVPLKTGLQIFSYSITQHCVLRLWPIACAGLLSGVPLARDSIITPLSGL